MIKMQLSSTLSYKSALDYILTLSLRCLPAALIFCITTFIIGNVDSRADDIFNRAEILTEKAANKLKTEIFRDALLWQRPDWIEKFDKIEIKINQKAVPNAEAGIEDGIMYIDVNSGVAMFVIFYARYAIIRSLLKDKHNKDCKNYIKYIGVELQSSEINISTSHFFSRIKGPSEFCGINTDEMSKVSAKIDELSAKTLIPALGLMIGHEYGHHLLGHLLRKYPDPVDQRIIEAEADRFGSTLLGDTFPRALASILYQIMARNRKSHPFAPKRRHDAAECRFLFFLIDDRRMLGELYAENLIKELKDRPDVTDYVPEAIEIVRRGASAQKVTSCEILR